MFRNFKQLVSRHPLIWNTKIIGILGVMLAAHILFFLCGFLTINDIKDMASQSRYDSIEDEAGTFIFSVLLIIIVIIIWLLFYLRNNPFKTFYPVTKWYLVKEFFLVWIIFLFSITLFHSFMYGRHIHILGISKLCNPEQEAEIINHARCFIPIEKNQYFIVNCCDSIQARRAFNQQASQQQPDYIDSCVDYKGAPYYRPSAPSLPERYSLREVLPVDFTNKQSQTIPDSFSYLYYCEDPFIVYGPDGSKQSDPDVLASYHQTSKRWLLNRNKDSIKNVLIQHRNIMKQYGIDYDTNIDSLVAWCFMHPGFAVENLVASHHDDNNDGVVSSYDLNEYNYDNPYNQLENAVQAVYSERQKDFFNLLNWHIYLYVSLGLSFILIMFRITRLKPWLSSIVGTGILSIIIAIIGLAGEMFVVYIIIILTLLFFTMAYFDIRSKRSSKLASAILLNWFAFGCMMLLPLIMLLVYKNTGEINECINNIYIVTRPAYPIHYWIDDNWDTINTLNIALGASLMTFVIIPLAYRWQGNPSE